MPFVAFLLNFFAQATFPFYFTNDSKQAGSVHYFSTANITANVCGDILCI